MVTKEHETLPDRFESQISRNVSLDHEWKLNTLHIPKPEDLIPFNKLYSVKFQINQFVQSLQKKGEEVKFKEIRKKKKLAEKFRESCIYWEHKGHLKTDEFKANIRVADKCFTHSATALRRHEKEEVKYQVKMFNPPKVKKINDREKWLADREKAILDNENGHKILLRENSKRKILSLKRE